MSAARAALGAFLAVAAPGCQAAGAPGQAAAAPAPPPAPAPAEPAPEPTFPQYARFLEGIHVCLDPGHGGDAHIPNYKRGPTGLREADANLRVARALRELLERAGAKVTLTREGDEDVPLPRRSEIANGCGADVFLSLHHNASEKPEVNGTTTWYHGDPDHSPASLDLARHVQFGVGEALGTPRWIVCPLLTDTLMYKTGFAVLRRLEIPGCLGEASYHTNPDEERRLRDPAYNRREAWGYFLALARYAAGGLPRARLVSPKPGEEAGACPEIRVRMEDGLGHRGGWGGEIVRLVPSSVSARLDGAPAAFSYDPKTGDVTLTPPADLAPGEHGVEVRAENIFGNHVVTRPIRFRVEGVRPAPEAPVESRGAIEFRLVAANPHDAAVELPRRGGDSRVPLQGEVIVDSSGIARAEVQPGRPGGGPALHLVLTDAAAVRLAKVSRANVGRTLAVVVDGQVAMEPVIRAELGADVILDGGFAKPYDEAELRTLAGRLSRRGR